ncbi:MAG TPA: enolase C-terminal domain-like protein, partial [Chloroflexota bacterium]|jgi:L-alanine-DL-glutamate epimerase-like enolase superfamily enzyme
VLIDAGLGYGADPLPAIRVARELEQLRIFWLEEPFLPDELDAYARLADSVDIRVAAGEEETTRWGFVELIERGHVDVVQPDVTRCGGITEILRIANVARERGRACVPHAWKSGIIKAASLHVNAVLPEAWFQEYCVAETPLNTKLTRQTFPLKDGFVEIPTSPGLGVDLDQEVLERYAVGSKPLPVAA